MLVLVTIFNIFRHIALYAIVGIDKNIDFIAIVGIVRVATILVQYSFEQPWYTVTQPHHIIYEEEHPASVTGDW
jgi:hypothetical protein